MTIDMAYVGRCACTCLSTSLRTTWGTVALQTLRHLACRALYPSRKGGKRLVCQAVANKASRIPPTSYFAAPHCIAESWARQRNTDPSTAYSPKLLPFYAFGRNRAPLGLPRRQIISLRSTDTFYSPSTSSRFRTYISFHYDCLTLHKSFYPLLFHSNL